MYLGRSIWTRGILALGVGILLLLLASRWTIDPIDSNGDALSASTSERISETKINFLAENRTTSPSTSSWREANYFAVLLRLLPGTSSRSSWSRRIEDDERKKESSRSDRSDGPVTEMPQLNQRVSTSNDASDYTADRQVTLPGDRHYLDDEIDETSYSVNNRGATFAAFDDGRVREEVRNVANYLEDDYGVLPMSLTYRTTRGRKDESLGNGANYLMNNYAPISTTRKEEDTVDEEMGRKAFLKDEEFGDDSTINDRRLLHEDETFRQDVSVFGGNLAESTSTVIDKGGTNEKDREESEKLENVYILNRGRSVSGDERSYMGTFLGSKKETVNSDDVKKEHAMFQQTETTLSGRNFPPEDRIYLKKNQVPVSAPLMDERTRDSYQSIKLHSDARNGLSERNVGEKNIDGIVSNGNSDYFQNSVVPSSASRLQMREEEVNKEGIMRSRRDDESILKSMQNEYSPTTRTRHFAGMQEDQLPFFHEDLSRAQSSVKEFAETFRSRKDQLAEQDREKIRDRRKRETSLYDRFLRGVGVSASSLAINDESHNTTVRHLSLNKRYKKANYQYNRRDEKNRSARKTSNSDTALSVSKKYQVMNQKRSKARAILRKHLPMKDTEHEGNVLREVKSFDNYVKSASNIQRLSDKKHGKAITSSKIKYPFIPSRRKMPSKSKMWSRLPFRIAKFRHDTSVDSRRKRYTNYYSPQSVTPMAYVHIQPAYPVPAPPPTNRKCVRCMVVYKPCPSPPRPPHRIILPTYKYQEPASKWRGLKYGCRCNAIGSTTSACDIVTGQCQCKPHVTGRQCDQCIAGYWGLTTGAGCTPCGCDSIGSYNSSCHDTTAQCYCKPGVGGARCDTCLAGYYGFSSNGCQVCDPCLRAGHICDPDTGRCVCPRLTFGEHCDRCRPGSWNLVPYVGCRPCACTLGSTGSLCDHQGQCPCRIGYDGLRCEKCAKGYYGYPRCRPCGCSLAGTLQCQGGVCDCNDDGQCPCKGQAMGRQCNQCKEGTFGLAAENPKGCTECFCFGRTTSCEQAGLSWGQRRLTRPRTLYINDTNDDIIIVSFGSTTSLSPVNDGLNITNGLTVIPGIENDVTIPSNLYYNYPLYWKLPEIFLGDKVVSYGGFLRFKVVTDGGIPLRQNLQYPTVQLQGNNKIVLEHYVPLSVNSNRYEVRFHESLWQLQNRPDYKVTREVLMVALQNLQYILVKASDNAEFTKTALLEASMDTAVLTPTHTSPLATGVEICKCPPEYNSTSCQDPSIGYYRWYKNTTATSTIVIDLIGQARRCQCNGRSENCDRETGYCLNCRENAAGAKCDVCGDSFYGHPEFGGCKPCPCPQADKRFSSTCMIRADSEPICVCKPGYAGRKCERCSYGYYGFPHLPDGKCIPCNCNLAGSLSDECDAETGQCRCRSGSIGRDCSECTAYRHVYINNVCTSCNDNCTGILLDTLTALSQELAEGTTHIADGYIPPPWEDLSYIDSNTTVYLEELDIQNKLKQRLKNVPWHEYQKLLREAEVQLRGTSEQAKLADNLKSKSDDLRNNIFSAKIEMDNVRKYIEDTILQLTQYNNENKRVEIKKALKMAKMILNNLKSVNLSRKTMEIQNFIEDVAEYSEWLNSLYDATEPLAIAQDDAEEYSVKLNDMRNVIEDTMETLFTYDGLYNNINQTHAEARTVCDRIDMIITDVNESMNEGDKLAKEASGFMVDTQNNLQDLPELRSKSTYWVDKLSMKEEILYRLNYEYDEKYVVPAVEHAKNLSKYVDQYVSLFSETRNIAASPLKASQAYKNIADGIKMANITTLAAIEITEDVYNKTFPGGPNTKSLLESAEEMSSLSKKQWDNAKVHGRIVKNTSEKLEFQKQAVNILKNTLNSTGIKDNQVNVKLRELQSNSKTLHENLHAILNDNDEVLEKLKVTEKLIDDYKERIADRLKPKLYELKREGDSKISLASEKLTEALSNIKKADAKLISLSNAALKRKTVFDKWNNTLASKLQNLKHKIAEARNTADGIRVSLKSDEGKECIRSYRPTTLQPASTNTIVMTFALPKERKEGSLLYLPSSVNDDFIALEIVDRKVRFVWNVGGGTGILSHPEIIDGGDLLGDKVWYRIEAERIRHIGRLNVRRQSSTTKGHVVINSTDSEYGRFDITTTDRLWIGGISQSLRRRKELIASNGLPGCVHQVILDGKPIGLWNFITTAPDMACKACVEGVEDARDDIAYSFNGEGYAVRNRVSSGPYNKYTFGVSLSFRTYDENALLFLAINPDYKQHIMIYLRDGKVFLRVDYGENANINMHSKFKYNTGNWTKVDAFRQYQLRKNIEKCSLSVGGEFDKEINAPIPQPKKEDIPDLAQAKYYFGGVPPSFRMEKLILPPQVSFLGCMSNIVVQEGYDPMAEQYYGVEPTCGSKPLKIVGFYGDGYLEHRAYTLRKINSVVSFSFRTMQKEAMLLLSTFEGREEKINNIRHANDEATRNNYYSVCIVNGQVQVRLNAGRGELVLQSNETFNDGRYHSVTIIKKRKEVELRIDDAYQSTGRLPTSAAIKAPELTGGLFFGGLPILINNTKMIATATPLYGAIKDAIFNDEIIRFDDVVHFEHALIGRAGPPMGKDPPSYAPSASLSRGMNTQPEGCQKVPYYSLEPGALKFGDKAHSHTQLYLNFKKFWEKKYAIEFDFRTYYPNGLLFITPGLRPKHYLMVVIRDGQLLLLVKSKQKKEIPFKTPFNDGNWHHVVISHDERKLTLVVDAQTPRTIKVPKKIGLASMMYIGGLPESGTPIPEQVVVKLETLKGCIRGLRVNGNVYDMVGSTSRAYHVGQCFPNVESGAYFQDEGYAVYKRNFELGAVLELQLEFRTSELSGVLLSITAPGGSPSLSLELNNGKVIMSGDLGDNNPLYVEQRFASPYTICDNRWHRIQAVYNDEELALKVDELDQKYGLPANVNYHIMDSTASGPLYIGGLPASAPKGTLITRDHFNGCIRNVMIGGERRDWTDMAELHNIHLSSCPIQ